MHRCRNFGPRNALPYHSDLGRADARLEEFNFLLLPRWFQRNGGRFSNGHQDTGGYCNWLQVSFHSTQFHIKVETPYKPGAFFMVRISTDPSPQTSVIFDRLADASMFMAKSIRPKHLDQLRLLESELKKAVESHD